MSTNILPKCFTSVIEHRHFTDRHDRLMELIQLNSEKRLLVVTGPTGVGKSTLLAQIKASVTKLAAVEMAQDPEVIAFGGCSVKAHGQTAFSWKDTYIQNLRSLQHPFADSDSPRKKSTSQDVIFKKISPAAAHSISNDRYFRKVEKAIKHRRPKAILLDEAHHLLRVGSSQSLLNQLEHLKYMADETRTPHVLFGTYELIRLLDLDSAVVRRREAIHFCRYPFDPVDAENSLEPFAEVVAIFDRDLAEFTDVDLLNEVPYLYQGSIGCVGVLRQWLFEAYSEASSKRIKITKELLTKKALKAGDKRTMLNDIFAGEKYFADQLEGEDEYLRLLGFHEQASVNPPKLSRKPKPGRRKPHNDKTGPGALDPNSAL